MTHTPGPWRVSENCQTDVFAGNRFVASAYNGYRAHVAKTDADNARLIAAAPELLAVAEMVLAHASVETPPELVRAATAALAKARGT